MEVLNTFYSDEYVHFRGSTPTSLCWFPEVAALAQEAFVYTLTAITSSYSILLYYLLYQLLQKLLSFSMKNCLQASLFTALSNYLSGIYCLWVQQHFFRCLFLFCCNYCSFTDCSPRKYWWKDSGNGLFLLVLCRVNLILRSAQISLWNENSPKMIALLATQWKVTALVVNHFCSSARRGQSSFT